MAIDGITSFERWTAHGGDDTVGYVSFERWTAQGSVTATSFSGLPSFVAWRATGNVVGDGVHLSGVASFEQWTARGQLRLVGSGTLQEWTANGRVRTNINGSASFERWHSASHSGHVSYERWTASGNVAAAVGTGFLVVAMNTRFKGVTEYDNFEFTDFGRMGGQYLAVGAQGLVTLGGSDDAGDNIQWALRTGQLDEGNSNLKRCTEVLMGLRSDGPVRVRVHSADNQYHDYTLHKVKANTIHQHRANVGKGLRSRWYSVEVMGVDGSDVEFGSLQVNMVPVKRRFG